jgi:hypothetical protein
MTTALCVHNPDALVIMLSMWNEGTVREPMTDRQLRSILDSVRCLFMSEAVCAPAVVGWPTWE